MKKKPIGTARTFPSNRWRVLARTIITYVCTMLGVLVNYACSVCASFSISAMRFISMFCSFVHSISAPFRKIFIVFHDARHRTRRKWQNNNNNSAIRKTKKSNRFFPLHMEIAKIAESLSFFCVRSSHSSWLHECTNGSRIELLRSIKFQISYFTDVYLL